MCKDDFEFLPSGNLDYNGVTLTSMFGLASNAWSYHSENDVKIHDLTYNSTLYT